MRNLYGIIDTLANDLVGSVLIFKADVAAIRFFGDIAAHPESQVNKHPEDYHLVCFGVLDDDMTIITEKRTIITGAQWTAAQQQLNDKLQEAR